MKIQIQPDYWTGTKCMEYEVPWQTPESIYYLDTLCKPTDTVLEIGTGGSTLFYASRCRAVLSLETSKEWYDKVKRQLEAKNITNVTYLLITEQRLIEDKLLTLTDFDIASVDSVHGYNRSAFLNIILKNHKVLSTLVLDNYADKTLFPVHYDKSINQIAELCGSKWVGKDFDDPHWCGRGTRILSIT